MFGAMLTNAALVKQAGERGPPKPKPKPKPPARITKLSILGVGAASGGVSRAEVALDQLNSPRGAAEEGGGAAASAAGGAGVW